MITKETIISTVILISLLIYILYDYIIIGVLKNQFKHILFELNQKCDMLVSIYKRIINDVSILNEAAIKTQYILSFTHKNSLYSQEEFSWQCYKTAKKM